MRKLIFSFFCLFLLSACVEEQTQKVYSDEEKHKIDSIISANRNVDSLEVLLRQYDSVAHKYGIVAVCKELGRSYRNASMFSEALNIHKKGLEQAQEIADTIHIIQAYNNIGTDYRRMGILDEASSAHYAALKYSELYSDKISHTAVKNRVVSLNGIGNVQLTLGNSDVAASVFREALKGEASLGSDVGQAINYANLGAILEENGDLDSARYYYTESLKCNERANSTLGISLCRAHFGRLYEKQGELDLAIDEYTKSYDLLYDSSDRWHWLDACMSLSRLNFQKGRVDLAWRYLQEAKQVAEKIKSLEHLVGVYHLEYKLYEAEGRYQQALVSLEKSNECSEQIAIEKNLTHMQNVRVGYERDKKKNEISEIQTNYHKEKARQNKIIWTTVLILILAFVVIVSLVYILRLRSKSQRMLKEMERTRTNFFTNITHEFRTPLTVITAAAEDIAMKCKSDKTVSRDASDIVRHSKGLLDLVSQILDIAKISSGSSVAPQLKRGDIIGFITMICESHVQYAQKRDIRIVYGFDQSSLQMDFIPSYIIRIVQNLLSNAIKFSYPGSDIYVSTKTEESGDGRFLKLYVCDTGIGMTPAQKNDVFNPFYQAHDDTKNIGSGVGLSLVKLTAEAMNGSVEVHSCLSEGSVFIVTLPVVVSPQTKDVVNSSDYVVDMVEPSTESVLEDDDDGNSTTPRILIVEDTPEVARWEMRQLNTQYNFYFAENGEDGLKKALEIVPDLIITDVMMPVMDGFKFCEKVRSNDMLSHIPVVMVTAKATQEDRLKGLELGADAYIEKPFNPKELSVRVENLLQQRELLRRKFSEHTSMEENRSVNISILDKAFLDKLSSAIHDMIEHGSLDYDCLASEFCVGKTQLNRKIKAITGFTTTDYIHQVRISIAKQLLIKTNLPIGDIASRIGIDDVSYFSLLFRKITGKTPSAYRSR